MTFPFIRVAGLIVVEAEVVGSRFTPVARLVLDTGSNGTIVDPVILTAAGYDLTRAPFRTRATTASGVVNVPRLPVRAVSALGRTVPNLLVAAHRVPTTAIDGVLGLDFFRNQVLTLDFQKSEITLTPGAPTP